jgi:hypothetical protein
MEIVYRQLYYLFTIQLEIMGWLKYCLNSRNRLTDRILGTLKAWKAKEVDQS